jgi:tetratricopeptide (TPR) repeat protein
MTTVSTRVAFATLVVLTSCGVFGLSSRERQDLALFQQNASLYWEGQRYGQALDAARRGLEIAPDDYKLHSIAAACYLRTIDQNAQNLRAAELLYDKLYDMRSLASHLPHALLGYGECHQELGLRQLRQAKALRDEAKDGRDLTDGERRSREARAGDHETKARYHWAKAERAFRALIDREEQLRDAHKHLMEMRVEQGDYPAAVEHGEKSLARNAIEQADTKKVIETTLAAAREIEMRATLKYLVEQEKRVRSALAEMHFRKQNYERAQRELTILLELDPTRSTDYYNRARVFEAIGNVEAARQDHKKFLATTKLPVGDERVTHAFQYTRE